MALRLLLTIMLIAFTTHAAPITKMGCITDCVAGITGDYQSCLGCHVYASCVNGILYDNRPCPSGLVWDDIAKRCLTTSSTCQTTTTARASTTTTTHPSRPSPSTSRPEITVEPTTRGMGEKISSQGLCTSSCSGRKDGDYQSCLGCHIYASCVNGILIDNRPCPSGLVWDDKLKYCAKTSSTCPASTTTPAPSTTTTTLSVPTNITVTTLPEGTTDGSYPTPSNNITASPNTSVEEAMPQSLCVSLCHGRKDGDYQSCISCHVYASCVNSILIDNRPCAAGLMWDDKAKQCLGSSSTCPGSTTTTTTTTPYPPTNITATPSSPEGTTDGSYPTPSNNFTASPNTSLEEAMPVEDISQSLCVSSCRGKKDGDYQSCVSCHVYASCVNGILIDNRPCAAGLVWDDKAKQCLGSSSTCPGSTTTTTTTQSPPTNITMGPSTPQPQSTTEAKASPTSATTNAASPSSSQPEVTAAATTAIQEKAISNRGLCVISCKGRTTGDYQSCLGCHVYASCVNGILIDNRPCPSGLVWDDNTKKCLTTSSTCHTTTTRPPTTRTTHSSRPSPSTSRPEITTEATTGVMGEKSSKQGLCVSSCSGRRNGDYQSCLGCHIYVSCVNGMLINNRPCPAGLVWDDNAKQCLKTSSTCQISTTTKAPTTTTTSKAEGTHPASTRYPETTATHTDVPHTTQDIISRAPRN